MSEQIMVTMGINDRDVARGIQRVENQIVSSTRSVERQTGGADFLFGKAASKPDMLIKSLTGISTKLGLVGIGMYAFKHGAEYLKEFESHLPAAERRLGELADATKKFKESWASDMTSGPNRGTAGMFADAGSWLWRNFGSTRQRAGDWVTDRFTDANGGALDLEMGDTAEAYRRQQRSQFEFLQRVPLIERALVQRKRLEADIAASKEDQLQADLARADAERVAASVELGRKSKDEGYGSTLFQLKANGPFVSQLSLERDAIRARYDAAVEKANRAHAEREKAAREKAAEDERRDMEARNDAYDRLVESRLAIEENRVRGMGMGERSATQERDAAYAQAELETRKEIYNLQRDVRDDKLSREDAMAEASSLFALRDQRLAEADRKFAKEEADRRRLEDRKREDGQLAIEEMQAQSVMARARTEEEKKLAQEIEAQVKARKDEMDIRRAGYDPAMERQIIQARRGLLDDEVAGIRRGKIGKGFAQGFDLSGAGARASFGQGVTLERPVADKVDRTNALLQQANQILRDIKQGQDNGGARFGP